MAIGGDVVPSGVHSQPRQDRTVVAIQSRHMLNGSAPGTGKVEVACNLELRSQV